MGSGRGRRGRGRRRFPATGSHFHHRVGLGLFALADHTEAAAVEPPRRLELKAKARPLGTARVTLELDGRGDGTEVLMTEEGGGICAASGC